MLHSQPELSGAEHVTTEMLVERLIVEGLQPIVLSTGTGLVCDISLDPTLRPDPATMPVVALRADIDALAMDDLTDTPYRSRHAGVAHACGHDVHTAALLGAALALLDVRRTAPQRAVVRLVFEPSEEVVPGGAVDVIADGWLEHVGCIYGVHCDPKLDVGTVGLRVGPLTAAADRFEIVLTGPGGHTARPHLTVDLVRWTGRIADRLAGVVQRLADGDVTLVFGAVHAGAAANVIPATAVLHGSFRTTDRATWVDGRRLIDAALAELIADPTIGEPPQLAGRTTRAGVPPVVNDVAATERVGRSADPAAGPGSVVDTPQSMGGDSFAWYLEHVPGTYVRLGTHDPAGDGDRRDLHSATFDVDERAIAIGATLLAARPCSSWPTPATRAHRAGAAASRPVRRRGDTSGVAGLPSRCHYSPEEAHDMKRWKAAVTAATVLISTAGLLTVVAPPASAAGRLVTVTVDCTVGDVLVDPAALVIASPGDTIRIEGDATCNWGDWRNSGAPEYQRAPGRLDRLPRARPLRVDPSQRCRPRHLRRT